MDIHEDALDGSDEFDAALNAIRSTAPMLESHIDVLREHTAHLTRQVEHHRRRASVLEHKLFIHAKSGLPNHHRLDAQLTELVDKQNQTSDPNVAASPEEGALHPERLALAIIRLDDKFDMVVRTLKSSISEWILYQVGNRLSECVHPHEYLFHTRDEEYVVLLRHFTNAEHLHARLGHLYNAVLKPHIFSGHHLHLGCSVGIAVFPKHGHTKSSLMHSADIALGSAVQRRKPWVIYQESMRNGAVEKLDLQNGMIRALESHSIDDAGKQFCLYFQPQIRMTAQGGEKARVTHVDAEVLMRWKHPRKGWISPEKFIPLAEETGLILPIGNWVLFKAIQQLDRWTGTPMEKVVLSVNISPKQFANEQLMNNLIALLERNPSIKERLKLEITETTLMDDPEKGIVRMQRLTAKGVRFALDDFGKGYSSLNYLTQLPLHSLKLDRSFITKVEDSEADQAIVRAVVFLASRLKLDLICEGIEELAQLKALLKQGARCFQGYLFSKAVAPGEFERFVQQAFKSPVVSLPE